MPRDEHACHLDERPPREPYEVRAVCACGWASPWVTLVSPWADAPDRPADGARVKAINAAGAHLRAMGRMAAAAWTS